MLSEDNVSGKIDDARFAKMAKRYEQEQGENVGHIKTPRLEVKKLGEKRMDVNDFLETVRRYHQKILKSFNNTPHGAIDDTWSSTNFFDRYKVF